MEHQNEPISETAPHITLTLGDAYELIRTVPDRSVNLILTDPPYELGKWSGAGIGETERPIKQLINRDPEHLLNGIDLSILSEFLRVCRPFNAYVFCSRLQLPSYLNWIVSHDFAWNILVYHKLNPMPLCADSYLSDKEYCLYIRERGAYLQPTAQNKRTVWQYSLPLPESRLYDHPTVKPMEMVTALITNSTRPRETVLDPFAGSGTTLSACKQAGRNAIGFEIDPIYYGIAMDRLRNVTSRDSVNGYEQMKLDI